MEQTAGRDRFSSWQKCLPHCDAIHFVATQVNLIYLPRVRNVLERIGIEDDKIRALAGRNRAEVIELKSLRCKSSRSDNDIGRIHARLRKRVELPNGVPTHRASWITRRITPENDSDARSLH